MYVFEQTTTENGHQQMTVFYFFFFALNKMSANVLSISPAFTSFTFSDMVSSYGLVSSSNPTYLYFTTSPDWF